MKNIKKIVFSLFTFIISFSTISYVFADSKGSIVINGTTSGKVYDIYKIFDLTYSGDKVSYTIDSDWVLFFDGDGSKYVVSEDTGSLNAITIDSDIKYINITDDNIEEFTNDALEYAVLLEEDDGSLVAEGESLVFSDLDLGYYLVYPRGATDVIVGNGSLCSITSTMPNAVVNVKAEYPSITKSVDDQNAFVGQLVEFTINGVVPDTVGYSDYIYEIKDTMSQGLELDSDVSDMKVKFGDDVIDVEVVYGDNSFVLTFDMTDYQEYVGEVITITYKARVTRDAVNSDSTMNSVTLTYSNNPKDDTTYTTTPIEIPVYSSLINVIKVDAKNEEVKLSGASFVLKNEDGLYYQAIDVLGNVITNVTSTSDVDVVNWVLDEEDATLLITGDDGVVDFSGVENGSYYLVEKEAPLGYNKLARPVLVKVGYDSEDVTKLGGVGVSHDEIVKNKTGVVLPITGGIGTIIFVVIGSVLLIVSSVLLIRNKKY